MEVCSLTLCISIIHICLHLVQYTHIYLQSVIESNTVHFRKYCTEVQIYGT